MIMTIPRRRKEDLSVEDLEQTMEMIRAQLEIARVKGTDKQCTRLVIWLEQVAMELADAKAAA
jgi:hypothetical protein